MKRIQVIEMLMSQIYNGPVRHSAIILSAVTKLNAFSYVEIDFEMAIIPNNIDTYYTYSS